VPFVKPRKETTDVRKELKPKGHTTPDTYYYKYGQALSPKISFEESDREILEMLQEVFLGKHRRLAWCA
jgi:hypothetical protein